MKFPAHLLFAGTLLFASACSSTSSTTETNSPSGASVNTSSGSVSDAEAVAETSAGAVAVGKSSGRESIADPTAFMASFTGMNETTFLINAASSDMLEVRLGRMATQMAGNPQVKEYGRMMVEEHSKSARALEAIAAPLNVTLPTELLPIHQSMADNLLSKTGKKFDEAYMDAMETAHKMDVAMFEAESRQAQVASVKDFAAKMLPTLRQHRDRANELEKLVD